jgi:hypothetical protein
MGAPAGSAGAALTAKQADNAKATARRRDMELSQYYLCRQSIKGAGSIKTLGTKKMGRIGPKF